MIISDRLDPQSYIRMKTALERRECSNKSWRKTMEEKAIIILKICAWLVLAIGFLGAVETRNIIYAAAVVTAWAFLLVVCLIAESLMEIRANTAQPAKSRLFDQETR